MITYKTFCSRVEKAVRECYANDFEVVLNKVQKNNATERVGLVIRAVDENVAPTMYLEEFYECYKDGVSFGEVIDSIVNKYERSKSIPKFNLDDFLDFGKAKERIVFRLCGIEKNMKRLEGLPYIRFGDTDLAVTFCYRLRDDALSGSTGSITILNEHMKAWGIESVDELYDLAVVNTPRILPRRFYTMREVLQKMLEESIEFDEANEQLFDGMTENSSEDMYVLSNMEKSFGASALLYPGILNEIVEKLGANLYILPSSVHEVIILPERKTADPDVLRQMVMEVNRTQVEPEDVLSDSVYYYNRELERLEISKSNQLVAIA